LPVSAADRSQKRLFSGLRSFIADQVIFAVPQGIEWQWAGMLLNANCVQLIFATFSTGFKNPLGKMPVK
jgi:hypothetical protein